MLADYRDRLGRGDVVTGSPVGFVGDGSIEIFLDNLFPPRKFIAPAHREIMADLDERFTFGRPPASRTCCNRESAIDHNSSNDQAEDDRREQQ